MKPGTLLKLTFLHGCFSRFLNCANGTKLRNVSHIGTKTFLKRKTSLIGMTLVQTIKISITSKNSLLQKI